MTAGVNGLDGSDRPEDGNSVVESYQTHRAPWLPPDKRREKRRGHPGDPTLDRKSGVLECAGEEAEALVFFVGELRVFVHELKRGKGS